MRKENLEITRTQQYIDSNLVPVQIGAQPKHGKDARVETSEKVKDDDQRKCYHCREAGHAKSQSRTRLKDLADAEGKPVTANTRPSSTAADAPLADDYVTMFSRDSATCQKKITMCTCQDRDNDEIGCG